MVTDADIYLAYRLFLGRKPGDTEVANMLKNARSHDDLRRIFLSSLEFRRNYRTFLEKCSGNVAPTYIHLHIPKTAGTSLNVLLAAQFPPAQTMTGLEGLPSARLATMTEEERRRIRLIVGHDYYGVHKLLQQPHIYLCILRLPGPRLFSYYNYIRRAADHPLHETVNSGQFSFGQFLQFIADNPRYRVEFDNGQVRRISGKSTRDPGGDEAALLELALDNLFQRDMIFGFQERFSDYLTELAEHGVIDSAQETRFNTSAVSTTFDEARAALSDGERELLAGFCHWDQRLYDAAMRHKYAGAVPK